MSWEYRIAVKYNEKYDTYEFGVIEVYYVEGTINTLYLWSEEFQEPSGETPEELRDDMKWMSKAFEKPVLNYNAMKANQKITDFEFEDDGLRYD